MKRQIEHIIFDLGGVLLNIDMARISAGFDKIMNLNQEKIKKIKLEMMPAYETGKITTEDFLAGLSSSLKSGYTTKNIMDIWNSIILDMPAERLNMVQNLRKKYRVHLLSNINDMHATCFEDNFSKWFGDCPANYFDQIFYSHIIGQRKPDVSTYTWVLEKLSSDPANTLFIDDMPENIEGARNAGINASQLMNEKTDVIKLMKNLGFLGD